NLDGETAGGAEVERPRAVEAARRRRVEAVVLQALVDLVHPLLGLLPETDVEAAGIPDLGGFAHLHEGKREPVIVEQDVEGAVIPSADHGPETEVFLQEPASLRWIGNGKIEVVQFHPGVSPQSARDAMLPTRATSDPSRSYPGKPGKAAGHRSRQPTRGAISIYIMSIEITGANCPSGESCDLQIL